MRIFLAVALVAAFVPGFLLAQDKTGFDATDLQEQIKRYLESPPEEPHPVRVGPDAPWPIPETLKSGIKFSFEKRMALSGHGVLFDVEGYPVELEPEEALTLQAELLQAIVEEKPGDLKVKPETVKNLDSFISELEASPLFAKGDPELRHLLLTARAWRLEPDRRAHYLWRSDFLMNHVLLPRQYLRLVLAIEGRRLQEILAEFLRRTTYMRDCKLAGVPVPPDFSVAGGGGWGFQGEIADILLPGSQRAQVWTWAAPDRRGACVALPRENGGSSDVAGIICQGANGNACFWDNLSLGTPSQIIPWAGNTLRIRDLRDGTNLALNCTGCHQGNNVFLVSPDETAWCRPLRGGRPGVSCAAPAGSNTGNLTLQVEASVNPLAAGGAVHSRYIPLSGQPGWANTVTGGCGGMCHLGGDAVRPPAPMPPACGSNCN